MSENNHKHEDKSPHEHEHPHKEDAHKHDEESHEAHGHDHSSSEHGHTHGVIDPSIAATERGLWAVKWSFIGLAITTLIQLFIFYFSGSIALLADAIHNVGDA